MIIIHDQRQLIDNHGQVVGTETHSIDTSNPAVLTMLQNLKGNLAAQATAGYAVPSGLGGTRWQQIVTAANAAGADPAVKALGLI